jgi:hypothetical protein
MSSFIKGLSSAISQAQAAITKATKSEQAAGADQAIQGQGAPEPSELSAERAASTFEADPVSALPVSTSSGQQSAIGDEAIARTEARLASSDPTSERVAQELAALDLAWSASPGKAQLAATPGGELQPDDLTPPDAARHPKLARVEADLQQVIAAAQVHGEDARAIGQTLGALQRGAVPSHQIPAALTLLADRLMAAKDKRAPETPAATSNVEVPSSNPPPSGWPERKTDDTTGMYQQWKDAFQMYAGGDLGNTEGLARMYDAYADQWVAQKNRIYTDPEYAKHRAWNSFGNDFQMMYAMNPRVSRETHEAQLQQGFAKMTAEILGDTSWDCALRSVERGHTQQPDMFAARNELLSQFGLGRFASVPNNPTSGWVNHTMPGQGGQTGNKFVSMASSSPPPPIGPSSPGRASGAQAASPAAPLAWSEGDWTYDELARLFRDRPWIHQQNQSRGGLQASHNDVRQALSAGWSKQEIFDWVQKTHDTRVHSPGFPPGSPAMSPFGYQFAHSRFPGDPEAAWEFVKKSWVEQLGAKDPSYAGLTYEQATMKLNNLRHWDDAQAAGGAGFTGKYQSDRRYREFMQYAGGAQATGNEFVSQTSSSSR